jgi:hypothetical protein
MALDDEDLEVGGIGSSWKSIRADVSRIREQPPV